MSGINGMRCVVTGASSGIGHAIAEQLVKDGATVVSLDRNPPTAAVDRHVTVDLAEPASIGAAVESLGSEWDSLINVAGIPGTASGELVFKVNYLGLRHLTESFLGSMNKGGSVVNVASIAGFQWAARLDEHRELLQVDTFDDGLNWFRDRSPEGNAYNFSKEAVVVYTMAMAASLVDQGLRMNALLPGPVETPILPDFEDSMGKETLDGLKDLLGRHATPDDIASAAVFLASPQSGWINGVGVPVDGGISGAVFTGIFPPPEI